MIYPVFTPFPVLHTNRLVLRQPELSDDHSNFLLRSNDHVNQYLEGFRHQTVEQTRTFLKKIIDNIENNESIFWIIILKSTGEFVGTICLWNISREDERAEAGYTLLPQFEGKGYMREALEAVIDYGFSKMKLKTIQAFTHQENKRSARLLASCQFELDAGRNPVERSDDVVFVLNNQKR